MTAVSYRVFVRNWWKWEHRGESYIHPGKPHRVKVPDSQARKTTLARHCTKEEAQSLCHKYNESHDAGPLSRKAEYERE